MAGVMVENESSLSWRQQVNRVPQTRSLEGERLAVIECDYSLVCVIFRKALGLSVRTTFLSFQSASHDTHS